MPRQGIEGARSMPVKVSVLCSPNALAGHWGNKRPWGSILVKGSGPSVPRMPWQSIGDTKGPLVLRAQCLAKHWGNTGPLGFHPF